MAVISCVMLPSVVFADAPITTPAIVMAVLVMFSGVFVMVTLGITYSILLNL